MKIYYTLFILILISKFTVQSQTFWGNSRYQMTLEEVVSKFPNAVEVKKDRLKLRGSEKELLRIRNHQYSGYTFDVHFIFKKKMLYCTRLSLKKRNGLNDLKGVYEILKDKLVKEYGSIIRTNKMSLGLSKSYIWVLDNTVIDLTYINYSPDSEKIILDYMDKEELNEIMRDCGLKEY